MCSYDDISGSNQVLTAQVSVSEESLKTKFSLTEQSVVILNWTNRSQNVLASVSQCSSLKQAFSKLISVVFLTQVSVANSNNHMKCGRQKIGIINDKKIAQDTQNLKTWLKAIKDLQAVLLL